MRCSLARLKPSSAGLGIPGSGPAFTTKHTKTFHPTSNPTSNPTSKRKTTLRPNQARRMSTFQKNTSKHNRLANVSDDDESSGAASSSCLPDHLAPRPNDVVCARGKSYWDHEGNKRYRALIQAATEKYSSTTNKLDKTLIVSEIVEAIHAQQGRFVKKEKKAGPWVVVDEVFAREKISQSLRDGLHDKYKSSTKAKQQRRAAVNEKFHDDVETAILSNSVVSQRMDALSQEVEISGSVASDFSIIELFTKANSDILETIKKDKTMMEKYEEAATTAISEFS